MKYSIMKEIETVRLYLKSVDIDDAAFILELINTPKWIRFNQEIY